MSPLVQDAINSVWSMPDPASQVIIRPSKISVKGGDFSFGRAGWEKYSLPDKTSYWYVYQIGQAHPLFVNLKDNGSAWGSMDVEGEEFSLICDAYNQLGVMIPKSEIRYRRLQDNNLVLAVRRNAKIGIAPDSEPIFFRFYRNPFHQRSDITASTGFKVVANKAVDTDDILAMQAEIIAMRAQPNYMGDVLHYVNGELRNEISVQTAQPGDMIEYVQDASIVKIATIPLNGIGSFVSSVDNKSKWLLSYESGWGGTIDHASNVDVYIYDTTTNRGRYVHKNAADTLRMVTFKDYSIVAAYVRQYFSVFSNVTTGQVRIENLALKLVIRADGIPQQPVDDLNKTGYLMSLTPAQRVAAMVGVDSNNPYWRAPHLEASPYNQLMQTPIEQITDTLVESAYGFTACNFKLAKNVVEAVQNTDLNYEVSLPAAYQNGATAYEYDTNGVFLGVQNVPALSIRHVCANANARIVELIQGVGSQQLDEAVDGQSLTVEAGYNYRAYTNASGSWTDVSNTSAVRKNNGSLEWVNVTSGRRILRSDKRHLTYSIDITPNDGVLLHYLTKLVDGSPTTLSVPFGEYDVWLNDHPLVEGIDYLIDFPMVLVWNKEYLRPRNQNQTLRVRAFGHCSSDLKPYKTAERGFAYNGVLSVNDRYDLHLNRNVRVVAGGALVPSSKQAFAETIGTGLFPNGVPYEIRELTNPMNKLLTTDPYALREIGNATEKKITNYLSLKVPQQRPAPISPIPDKYVLYSPFLGKLISAMKSGSISQAQLSGQYPDSQVQTLVSPYLNIYRLDPINPSNVPDLTYCVIHPHWDDVTIGLTADQFRFLKAATRIYAQDRVTLSTLVQVTN